MVPEDSGSFISPSSCTVYVQTAGNILNISLINDGHFSVGVCLLILHPCDRFRPSLLGKGNYLHTYWFLITVIIMRLRLESYSEKNEWVCV